VDLPGDVRAHDEAVRRAGAEIWIGAEPTFTDRTSQAPWWLWQAEGGDKEARALVLLRALAQRLGAARLVRAVGRQFPEEPAPRFCLGCLFRRGAPTAPPDERLLGGHRIAAPAAAPGESWLTVTPDPAVIEVNTAPSPDLASFLADAEAVYAAAGEAGLSPLRWRYNGAVVDSGGGGQITLGGPSPERSPFFLRPQLLPRLVRYLNRHPSLSYAFAPDCAGSAGQGPRPDEGVRELFEELPVALERLSARGERLLPEELWEALSPLLVDPSGNSHRAELNVEKLWNPHLPRRGRLGLVEFRSVRMSATPARLAAVGALLRAVAARLAALPFDEPVADWGADLHDRLALPWFLEQDLRAVLDDLAARELGLGPALRAELLDAPEPACRIELDGATLTATPALEFWPLVGDVASQEKRGARTVDSSSERIQLLVEAPHGDPGALAAGGWAVPLRQVGPGRWLAAVRWRAFQPRPGLHPDLPPRDPLVLRWSRGPQVLEIGLHGWIPGGGAYPGLPADPAEAERRRRERVVVRSASPGQARAAPGNGLTLDLRRLPAA